MDAARLLADGTTVTLADGSVLAVRFDFESLLRLEVEYGSIFRWADDLPKRPLACIVAALKATVRDREVTPAELDSKRLTQYRLAVMAAWIESMPDRTDEKPADEGKADGEPGTGASSTPSPRSPAGAPSMSSAA